MGEGTIRSSGRDVELAVTSNRKPVPSARGRAMKLRDDRAGPLEP